MVILYLTGCCLFVVMQGFFSASEISFISSSVSRLRHRQSKGERGASLAYSMILNPEKFLATTLVGSNISVVISTSLLTSFLSHYHVGSPNLWVTLIFTPFVVIFAELVPKNMGRFYRENFSCRTAVITYYFERLFLPFINVIESMSKRLVELLVKKRTHRSPFVTKEEIRYLIREIESQGGIDRGEKAAIDEVFEFRSDKIKDVCLPIKNIAAFDYTDSRKLILDKIKKHNFTRYLVYKNKEIIGYVNIYDLFYDQRLDWQVFVRSIPKVGINQKLYEVFTKLQSQRESIALVIKGKKAHGIITVRDITREITSSIIK